jgi:hypothetical protein
MLRANRLRHAADDNILDLHRDATFVVDGKEINADGRARPLDLQQEGK